MSSGNAPRTPARRPGSVATTSATTNPRRSRDTSSTRAARNTVTTGSPPRSPPSANARTTSLCGSTDRCSPGGSSQRVASPKVVRPLPTSGCSRNIRNPASQYSTRALALPVTGWKLPPSPVADWMERESKDAQGHDHCSKKIVLRRNKPSARLSPATVAARARARTRPTERAAMIRAATQATATTSTAARLALPRSPVTRTAVTNAVVPRSRLGSATRASTVSTTTPTPQKAPNWLCQLNDPDNIRWGSCDPHQASHDWENWSRTTNPRATAAVRRRAGVTANEATARNARAPYP